MVRAEAHTGKRGRPREARRVLCTFFSTIVSSDNLPLSSLCIKKPELIYFYEALLFATCKIPWWALQVGDCQCGTWTGGTWELKEALGLPQTF